MIVSIVITAVTGLCIALYAYAVERKIEHDPNYKPVCDISDRVSCSKPIKSSYSHMLYISNALIGMIYYIVIAILGYFDMTRLLINLTFLGALISCIMAYILFTKIKSACLVCIALYIINFILLYLSLHACAQARIY